MKAQSWRKILGLTNGALVLSILGAGAWWFTQVRPASADRARPPAWVKPAFDVYLTEAKGARPRSIYPVLDKDITEITRPDLMNPIDKGGPFVWPYVGPVPPPKKEVKVETGPTAPPPPSGLEVLGKPVILFSDPSGQVVLTWLFKDTPPNKGGSTIARGEPFIPAEEKFKREAENAEKRRAGPVDDAALDKALKKGRFKLKDGWHIEGPPGGDRKVMIVYEVYDEATDTLQKVESKEFVLASDAPKVDIGGVATTAPGSAAGAGGSRGASTPDLGVAPPLSEVHVVLQSPTPSTRRFEADEATFRYLKYSDPDKLMNDVKTEDATDKDGNKIGVKVQGVNPGSFASQFDVRPGDILKAINGTPVHNRAEAVEVVKNLPKDVRNVQVIIERNGRQITYDVDPRDPKVRAAGGTVRYDNKPPGK